jgi:hypothetical protein
MGSSFRQTVAGIFARQEMNETLMLSSHLESTLSRMAASDGVYIIAAQDTTYYNYSGQKELSGLGIIQGKVRGLMQHNVLMLSESGIPLGLLSQQYWTRQGGKDLPPGEKESNKWHKGLHAINEHTGQLPKRIVAVEDREGDIFSFFKAERQPNVELLVRVHQPRTLEVLRGGEICKLTAVQPYLSDYGQMTVDINRDNRAVQLILSLRAGAVDIYPDPGLSISKHKTQGFSLVIAQEVACIDLKTQQQIEPPPAPAIWYLLTTLPVSEREEVTRIVHFYALRWRIERFHYTLKSGALQVEKLQFDDIHTLINALVFYSVVAWQLLAITYALRENPQQPPELLFEPSEIQILQQICAKKVTSLGDAVLALAGIIGFAPSKKQPFPGVKVLATALDRFAFIKLGFDAFSKPLQD